MQYTGGCAEHQEMFSTLGDIMSTLGVFSTPGDIMSTLKRHHDKCGGRSLGKQLNLYGNPSILNIPQYTEHPPVY